MKRYEKVIQGFVTKRRPPAHLRNEVDLGFRLTGQSIEIFEIRSAWEDPKEKFEQPVAKATYIKRQNLWKIYWMKSDLKWHKYEPEFEVSELLEFVTIVDNDQYGCFWG